MKNICPPQIWIMHRNAFYPLRRKEGNLWIHKYIGHILNLENKLSEFIVISEKIVLGKTKEILL